MRLILRNFTMQTITDLQEKMWDLRSQIIAKEIEIETLNYKIRLMEKETANRSASLLRSLAW